MPIAPDRSAAQPVNTDPAMSSVPATPARALNCAGRAFDISRPRVMGILNITPDSFSDGGLLLEAGRPAMDRILRRAEAMVADGADMLDIGGESTRPGALSISADEELDRVVPVIERLARTVDVPLSIDTSTPAVMIEAAARGAGMINDVRALTRPGAIRAAAATGLPVCLMHMRGEPGDMQHEPQYHDVMGVVTEFLRQRVDACTTLGVARRNIVLDPGFGFGKTVGHNLTLLNRLPALHDLGFPLLVGLSRKSLIGQITGRPVADRLAGSLALAAIAAMKGAVIIRVHDVRETADVVRLCHAVARESAAD
jgi:dihydropteroate synthase